MADVIVYLQNLIVYLQSNWQTIVVTFIISTLFFLLSNYAIQKTILGAEQERKKNAKNSLLDILEARIINKQEISPDKINNLISSIEREHSTKLPEGTTAISLLQDLDLIFEKSHHLDPKQKNDYCIQIKDGLNTVKSLIETERRNEKLPTKYEDIVDKLSNEIQQQDSKNALKTLEALKKKVSEIEISEPEITFDSTYFTRITGAITAAFAAVMIYLTTSDAFIYSVSKYLMYSIVMIISLISILAIIIKLKRM